MWFLIFLIYFFPLYSEFGENRQFCIALVSGLLESIILLWQYNQVKSILENLLSDHCYHWGKDMQTKIHRPSWSSLWKWQEVACVLSSCQVASWVTNDHICSLAVQQGAVISPVKRFMFLFCVKGYFYIWWVCKNVWNKSLKIIYSLLLVFLLCNFLLHKQAHLSKKNLLNKSSVVFHFHHIKCTDHTVKICLLYSISNNLYHQNNAIVSVVAALSDIFNLNFQLEITFWEPLEYRKDFWYKCHRKQT